MTEQDVIKLIKSAECINVEFKESKIAACLKNKIYIKKLWRCNKRRKNGSSYKH